MTRLWIALGLIAITIAAANAIPGAQQIIIFGGGSSASGGGGGACTPTGLDFSQACNSMYVSVIH